MKAIRIHEYGGPEVMNIEEIPRPKPTADELLIEVIAAGVNPVDTYFREGTYDPCEMPFTPGVDFSGLVVETGENTEGFEIGDKVFGTGVGNDSYQGSYAEYLTVTTDRVAHLPEGVDGVEASAAGVVAGTAWRALIDYADIKPNEYCVIHGGSGGVGHVAVQIGKAMNAHVISTCAPAYQEQLIKLGSTAAIDYDSDRLAQMILEASNGGVDVVVDHRLDDYLQLDTDVANKNARIIGIGENSSNCSFSNSTAARLKDINYQFMSLFNSPDLSYQLDGVSHLMELGEVSINLHKVYNLEEVGEAHKDLMNKSIFGKIAITP